MLRPLTGPMRIPELTVRLQNPQVQYSPGSIPISGTIPLPRGAYTHLNLLTNMHSWYLQENISSKAHKHIHPGHRDQKDSEPENQVPSPCTPCISSALLFNPECLLQAHPVYYQHYFVTQGVFSEHTELFRSLLHVFGTVCRRTSRLHPRCLFFAVV